MTRQEKIESFKHLVVEFISSMDSSYVRPTEGAYYSGRSYCQLIKKPKWFGVSINVGIEPPCVNLHLWNDNNIGIRLWLENGGKTSQIGFGVGAHSQIVENRRREAGHVFDVVRKFDVETSEPEETAELVAKDFLIFMKWLEEQGVIDLLNGVRSEKANRVQDEIEQLKKDANGMLHGEHECMSSLAKLPLSQPVVARDATVDSRKLALTDNGTDLSMTPGVQSLRPIPTDKVYSAASKKPCEIDGVISWVTTVGAMFEREEILLSDGRRMCPGQYVIPPYQRKYTWSYDNVSQLCRDLLKSADDGKESYHLGTVILHHQAVNDGDAFYVVDGQQRLTTISYLIGSEIFAAGASSPKIRNADIENILSALEEYKEDKYRILEQLKRSTIVVIAVNDINEAFQLFSTQNGRGRPLTPANLLKAYHLHEMDRDGDAEKRDRIWEVDNGEKIRDGRLLSQVLGEHLYRLRCWSRGDFPVEPFTNVDIKEFKGITFKKEKAVGVPAQNLMKLRIRATSQDHKADYYLRSENDGMGLWFTIDQPIVNGADFFCYMESYAKAYRTLFGETEVGELQDFKSFYVQNCNYKRSGRRGDTYARHVFESLCLFCYDRFGAKGLAACMRYLYRFAYYERAVKSRCYYSTCGAAYSIQAVRAMTACMTLGDVKDRLHALSNVVLEQYRSDQKVLAGKPIPDGVDQVRSVYENQ